MSRVGYADDVNVITRIGHTVIPTLVALQNAEWVLRAVYQIKQHLREYMRSYPTYIPNETVIMTL